jgi:hypothetical protein
MEAVATRRRKSVDSLDRNLIITSSLNATSSNLLLTDCIVETDQLTTRLTDQLTDSTHRPLLIGPC